MSKNCLQNANLSKLRMGKIKTNSDKHRNQQILGSIFTVSWEFGFWLNFGFAVVFLGLICSSNGLCISSASGVAGPPPPSPTTGTGFDIMDTPAAVFAFSNSFFRLLALAWKLRRRTLSCLQGVGQNCSPEETNDRHRPQTYAHRNYCWWDQLLSLAATANRQLDF